MKINIRYETTVNFTKLIICDAHESIMHHSVESKLARVQTRYWITKKKKECKGRLRKCVVCKRHQGKPLRAVYQIVESPIPAVYSCHPLRTYNGHINWRSVYFERFIARRGIPDIMINDDVMTFRSRDVKQLMLHQGIKQQLTLLASSWWEGFYERLARTVKSCLKKTLGRAYATSEQL